LSYISFLFTRKEKVCSYSKWDSLRHSQSAYCNPGNPSAKRRQCSGASSASPFHDEQRRTASTETGEAIAALFLDKAYRRAVDRFSAGCSEDAGSLLYAHSYI
jgi:hypothetical protein